MELKVRLRWDCWTFNPQLFQATLGRNATSSKTVPMKGLGLGIPASNPWQTREPWSIAAFVTPPSLQPLWSSPLHVPKAPFWDGWWQMSSLMLKAGIHSGRIHLTKKQVLPAAITTTRLLRDGLCWVELYRHEGWWWWGEPFQESFQLYQAQINSKCWYTWPTGSDRI